MSEPIRDDAERKQVTVLFADVSGSMDLAEGQDPERWREIMQRFFSILAESVARFEGTVDKFTGDGIMAVFGAPVAYEDHARRACYAALRMLDDVAEYAAELRREQGLNFSTRIGINSGEVVAGAIGEGGDGAYTAIGHTVGLAQRMEALAEPGRAYLTEHAAELARGYLDLTDLGEFDIKGASRPVRVFELAGVGDAHSRIDLALERGLSRFVGRDREIELLEEALRNAEAGQGGAIGLVAEPGVGKSRLCYEFVQRCRAEGAEVFEAQAQSHGVAIPYMPILQMLRSLFGIDDRDEAQLAREKIAGRTLLLDPGFADDLPLLFDFLGVPDPGRPVPQMSPEGRQRALGDVVCRLANAPSRRKTLVLVVEDLHWIDGGSEALLADLVEAIEDTNTLLVANFRPEYAPPWAAASGFRQVPLEALRRADTRELLADLTGRDPSLDGLDEPVHERTRGNPFFVEEIVRELAESGYLEGSRGAYRLVRPVEDAGVPRSVQAVLAARIDRLDPAAKRLLQVASVVGREVDDRALGLTAGLAEEELEEVLGELIAAGFLLEAELYPRRVLAFRHPLTREVAYGTQLAAQREATHAAVARAMVELNRDRHDELSALIAQHFREGGETLEAARWSARAAYWTGSSQPAEALRLWQAVTRLAAELEEGEETSALAVTSRLRQLDLAWRLGMDEEEERRLTGEAEEIAERTGDLGALALLRMITRARPGLTHDTATWVEAADEATRLADESGNVHLRVAVRTAGSYARLHAADFESFERTLDEVIELSGGDPAVGAGIVIGNPVAWALMGKGTVRREQGEFEEAERLFDSAVELTAETEDPETASWIRGTKALHLSSLDDPEGGLALARRNYELTERLGDVFSRSIALTNLSITESYAGEYAAALESIEEADRLYREAMRSGGEMECWRGAVKTEALLGVGRVEEAIEVGEAAAEVGRERTMLWSLPLALLALGRARIANGEAEAAREALAEGAEIAERTGALVTNRLILDEIESIGAEAR